MPVRGSTISASCEKRPISTSGVVLPFRNPTSKTHPCPATAVSSHVSQLPQGVTPPAQFRTVPARLDHADNHLPCRVSKIRLLVPPRPVCIPAGVYVISGRPVR